MDEKLDWKLNLPNWLTVLWREFQKWLPRRRKEILVFIAGVVAPMALVLILAGLIPALRHSPNPPESPPVSKTSRTTSRSEVRVSPQKTPAQLMREKSELELEQLYLKSRLQLARTDSIYLSLNLPDSTLTIEIKGVPLRECHIVKFKFNFELETKPALANWLAAPFILRSKTATIPKAPIRVKEAPSDTIEAKEMSEIDIPVEKGFVYFTLDFDRNLSVSIAQEKAESVIGWTQKIFHKALTGSKATVRKLGDLVLPGERDYVRVYLEVSGADAKAIYRALPSNAGLAFRPTLSQ